MVEQWSPKPKVKGSNPFSPEMGERHVTTFLAFPRLLDF